MDFKDDVAFLSDPERWPHWPVCPVKRYPKQGQLECGVVSAGSSSVYLGNLFTMLDNLGGLERIVYQSIEAMVADGWMVD